MRKYCITIAVFVLLLININICSANIDIDKLLLETNKIRSSNFNQLTTNLEKLSQYQHEFSNEQLELFNFLNSYKKSYSGMLDEALKTYSYLYKKAKNKEIIYRSLLAIINTYAAQRNWPLGLKYVNQLSNKLNDVPETIFVEGIVVLSVFYNQLGKYNKTLQVIKQFKNVKVSARNQCLIDGLKIEATVKENSPNTLSLFEVKKALSSCKQAKEPLMTAFIYHYIASNYLAQGNQNQAITELTNQLNLIESTRYPRLISDVYSTLAQAYFANNNIGRAQEFAEKTIAAKASFIGTEAIANAFKILYQIAKQQADYQAALQYHEQYMQSNNAYLDEVKAKALAYQLAEHQSLEQQNQIALLDRQNNLLKTEKKLAKAEAENNRLFISLLIALSTLLVFWVYKNKLTQQKLKQLAEYDTLTRLINRGHFTQLAESLLAKLKRQQQPVSMIMFDLDKFKAINDTYGHATGDWVLKQVSSTLSKIVRKNDILARLGGEEFAILLPNCEQAKAQQLANYYRQAVADIDCADSGFDFTISASFGVTDNQLSGYKFDTLLAHADYALYASKRSGRNQVTVYNSSIPAINITPSDKS